LKPIIHPQLINDEFGDPGLYIEFQWERRAILFDLGSNLSLSPRMLLKVTDICVSHTHIDHFIGFDHLLRILLGRDAHLRIFGPTGIISHVEGKLSSYTWNLIEDYPLSIEVFEIGETIGSAIFKAKAGFKKERGCEEKPFNGIILDEPRFTIETVFLDHRTPSLAFSLEEKFHINIDKEKLKQLNLPVGPWLRELKEAIWEGEEKDRSFIVKCVSNGTSVAKAFSLGFLKAELVTITEGQKITYVTDAVFSEKNREKIVTLARGSDIFFCEATFLDTEKNKARERYHLTAKEAGILAREAKVKNLEVFHFSPRYRNNPEDIVKEANRAFHGGSGEKS
jgi:ribonuclease Z